MVKPKKKEPEKKISFTVWNVPKPTKDAFKVACARKGVTMKDEIVNFMFRFAKQHG